MARMHALRRRFFYVRTTHMNVKTLSRFYANGAGRDLMIANVPSACVP